MTIFSEPRYSVGQLIEGVYEVYGAIVSSNTEIYFCFHKPSMQPRTLKTFRADIVTYDMRMALYSEAANWLAVKLHPNIVCCFGIEELEFRPYIVLEWLSVSNIYVTNLENWLKQQPMNLRKKLSHTPLEPLDALQIGIDIARALEHLASLQPGLVHCDLKPENILIGHYIEFRGETAKLIDFGAAQVTNSIGNPAGTPAYMAPEQWTGSPLTARTDIYAFGCLLYELFTGKTPFVADSRGEFRTQHLDSIIPACDFGIEELATIISSCLAKDASQRPDAVQVRVQLEQIFHNATGNDYRELPKSEIDTEQIIRRVWAFKDIAKYDLAFKELDQLRDRESVYLSVRASIYAKMKQFDNAERDLKDSLKLSPDQHTTLYLQATVLYAQNRLEEALNAINRALDFDPTNGTYQGYRGIILDELGEFNEAVQAYAAALAINPKDASVLMDRPVTYIKQGRWNDAIDELYKAIKLHPSDPHAYNTLGQVYRNLKMVDKSIENFSKAIELAPLNAEYYANRAVIYEDIEDYESSRADWEQAIVINPHNARYIANLGTTLRRLGLIDEALDAVNRSLAIDPYDSQALNLRGTINMASTQLVQGVLDMSSRRLLEAAIDDFSVAIEHFPREVNVYFNRGKCYCIIGQYDAAIADFTTQIQLVPTDAEAYNWRGLAYEDNGDIHAALADYTRALQLDPSNRMYQHDHAYALRLLGNDSDEINATIYTAKLQYKKGEAINQLQIFLKRIEENPLDTEALLRCGDIYRSQGDYQNAFTCYERLLAIEPANAYAHLGFGACLEGMGKYPEAIQEYEESLKAEISDAAHRHLANIYLALKQYEKAMEAARKALMLSPQNIDANTSLALSLIHVGREDDALEVLGKLAEFDSTNPETFYTRAVIQRRLGRLETALADIERAMAQNSSNAKFFQERGRIYEGLMRFNKALEDYNQAISLDSFDDEFFSSRGSLYLSLERFDLALVDYTRAIELCSYEDARLYHARGLCFNKLSRLEEARSDFSKTIELDPNFVAAHFDLGVIYYKQKRLDDAKKLYRKTLQLDPKFTSAYVNLAAIYIDERFFVGAYFSLDQAAQQGDSAAERAKYYYKYHWTTFPQFGSKDELTRIAIELWQIVDTFEEMRSLASLYHFMLDDSFLSSLDLTLRSSVTGPVTRQYTEKLTWLYQLQRLVDREYENGYLEAFLLRANQCERNGNYKDAITEYTRALKEDPNLISALSSRAAWFDLLGDYEGAIADYSRAIQHCPDPAGLFSDRADTYNNMGEFEKAIQDCDDAIRRNPYRVLAYGNRSVAYAWLGQYQQVLDNALAGLELIPDNAIFLNNIGYGYHLLGKLKLAEKYYAASCRIDPRYITGLSNLGNLYADAGAVEPSKHYYEYVLSLEPSNYFYWIALGCLYVSIGLPAIGLYYFEDAYNAKQEMLTEYYLEWVQHMTERNDNHHFGSAIYKISHATSAKEVYELVDNNRFLAHPHTKRHLLRLASQMPAMFQIGDHNTYPRLKWLAQASEIIIKTNDTHVAPIDLPDETSKGSNSTLALSFFQRGIADLNKKLYARALVGFRRARELDLHNADYAVFSAVANYMHGNETLAADDLMAAHAINADSAEYITKLYSKLMAKVKAEKG